VGYQAQDRRRSLLPHGQPVRGEYLRRPRGGPAWPNAVDQQSQRHHVQYLEQPGHHLDAAGPHAAGERPAGPAIPALAGSRSGQRRAGAGGLARHAVFHAAPGPDRHGPDLRRRRHLRAGRAGGDLLDRAADPARRGVCSNQQRHEQLLGGGESERSESHRHRLRGRPGQRARLRAPSGHQRSAGRLRRRTPEHSVLRRRQPGLDSESSSDVLGGRSGHAVRGDVPRLRLRAAQPVHGTGGGGQHAEPGSPRPQPRQPRHLGFRRPHRLGRVPAGHRFLPPDLVQPLRRRRRYLVAVVHLPGQPLPRGVRAHRGLQSYEQRLRGVAGGADQRRHQPVLQLLDGRRPDFPGQ